MFSTCDLLKLGEKKYNSQLFGTLLDIPWSNESNKSKTTSYLESDGTQ